VVFPACNVTRGYIEYWSGTADSSRCCLGVSSLTPPSEVRLCFLHVLVVITAEVCYLRDMKKNESFATFSDQTISEGSISAGAS